MDTNGLRAELERVANEPLFPDGTPFKVIKASLARHLLDTYFGEDKCEWEKAVEVIFDKAVAPYQVFMNDAWIPFFLASLIDETEAIENIRKLPSDEAREYLRLFAAEAARQIQKKWNALVPEDSK